MRRKKSLVDQGKKILKRNSLHQVNSLLMSETTVSTISASSISYGSSPSNVISQGRRLHTSIHSRRKLEDIGNFVAGKARPTSSFAKLSTKTYQCSTNPTPTSEINGTPTSSTDMDDSNDVENENDEDETKSVNSFELEDSEKNSTYASSNAGFEDEENNESNQNSKHNRRGLRIRPPSGGSKTDVLNQHLPNLNKRASISNNTDIPIEEVKTLSSIEFTSQAKNYYIPKSRMLRKLFDDDKVLIAKKISDVEYESIEKEVMMELNMNPARKDMMPGVVSKIKKQKMSEKLKEKQKRVNSILLELARVDSHLMSYEQEVGGKDSIDFLSVEDISDLIFSEDVTHDGMMKQARGKVNSITENHKKSFGNRMSILKSLHNWCSSRNLEDQEMEFNVESSDFGNIEISDCFVPVKDVKLHLTNYSQRMNSLLTTIGSMKKKTGSFDRDVSSKMQIQQLSIHSKIQFVEDEVNAMIDEMTQTQKIMGELQNTIHILLEKEKDMLDRLKEAENDVKKEKLKFEQVCERLRNPNVYSKVDITYIITGEKQDISYFDILNELNESNAPKHRETPQPSSNSRKIFHNNFIHPIDENNRSYVVPRAEADKNDTKNTEITTVSEPSGVETSVSILMKEEVSIDNENVIELKGDNTKEEHLPEEGGENGNSNSKKENILVHSTENRSSQIQSNFFDNGAPQKIPDNSKHDKILSNSEKRDLNIDTDSLTQNIISEISKLNETIGDDKKSEAEDADIEDMSCCDNSENVFDLLYEDSAIQQTGISPRTVIMQKKIAYLTQQIQIMESERMAMEDYNALESESMGFTKTFRINEKILSDVAKKDKQIKAQKKKIQHLEEDIQQLKEELKTSLENQEKKQIQIDQERAERKKRRNDMKQIEELREQVTQKEEQLTELQDIIQKYKEEEEKQKEVDPNEILNSVANQGDNFLFSSTNVEENKAARTLFHEVDKMTNIEDVKKVSNLLILDRELMLEEAFGIHQRLRTFFEAMNTMLTGKYNDDQFISNWVKLNKKIDRETRKYMNANQKKMYSPIDEEVDGNDKSGKKQPVTRGRKRSNREVLRDQVSFALENPQEEKISKRNPHKLIKSATGLLVKLYMNIKTFKFRSNVNRKDEGDTNRPSSSLSFAPRSSKFHSGMSSPPHSLPKAHPTSSKSSKTSKSFQRMQKHQDSMKKKWEEKRHKILMDSRQSTPQPLQPSHSPSTSTSVSEIASQRTADPHSPFDTQRSSSNESVGLFSPHIETTSNHLLVHTGAQYPVGDQSDQFSTTQGSNSMFSSLKSSVMPMRPPSSIKRVDIKVLNDTGA